MWLTQILAAFSALHKITKNYKGYVIWYIVKTDCQKILN